MKETRFIEQNKEKWLESENLLKQRTKDPEKLSTLFTQVVDDLSYSRTFYPNRSVRVYLNKISRDYFSIIYNHQRTRQNRFRSFWLEELPQVVIHCRKQLIISLIIFLVSAGIGIFSAYNDPEFVSSILGESYVAMTKENIEKGDPMAVYKRQHQVNMFLGITYNNLMVAFRTFVSGVFFSVGTIAILLYNGIMVGCFQFFFIERGLFAESALSIWLHGTLEISSIIIAGGAGLTLGSGLVFPGTYSRLQAFQISAIRSLKLMLGIAPIFVFASLIESFLTRYTDVPDLLRLFLILLSAAFIIGYFVVYPWWKLKRGFAEPLRETRIQPSVPEIPDTDRVKTNAELLRDGFTFWMKFTGKLFPWIAGVTLAVTILHYKMRSEYELPVEWVSEMWWLSFFNGLLFALTTTDPLFILINAAGTTIIVSRAIYHLRKETGIISSLGSTIASVVQTLFVFALFFGTIYWLDDTGIFFLFLVFIPILMWIFVLTKERLNVFSALGRTVTLCTESFGQVFGLQVVLALLCLSFLVVLNAPIFYFNIEVLKWQFTENSPWAQTVLWIVQWWTKILAFYLIIPLVTGVSAYLYFTLLEIRSAENLNREIALLGTRGNRNKRR